MKSNPTVSLGTIKDVLVSETLEELREAKRTKGEIFVRVVLEDGHQIRCWAKITDIFAASCCGKASRIILAIDEREFNLVQVDTIARVKRAKEAKAKYWEESASKRKPTTFYRD